MNVDTQRRLVSALAATLGSAMPGERATEVVETHISWVILAGEFAYKLKKPLDLGFLDFTTLAKRRHACEEEIRLNRRTAPGIYLDVAAIGGSADAPLLDATPAIDYAVRMRRFAREEGLDFLIAQDALGPGDINQVAAMISAFHAAAARSVDGAHGAPARTLDDALANFSQMPPLQFEPETRERLHRLRAWTLAEHARQAALMDRRMRAGQVRECHGDLHLANMVRHDGQIVAFDCIEFNPEMRWMDVMNDLAFTLMDLRHRGHAEFARMLADAYLSLGGDWEGVPLLPFYLCYRAMVRAKVAAFRAAGAGNGDPERNRALRDCLDHLALAETYTRPGKARLVITSGVSGSGKSYLSGGLVQARDWLRLRSDVERKRLAALSPLEASGSGPDQGIYSAAMTAQVYARLAALADALLGAGFTVIVDATFLKREQRKRFGDLAAQHRAPFTILATHAGREELERRIIERAARGNDASEADLRILAAQLASAEPLDHSEISATLVADPHLRVDATALAQGIEARDGAAPSRAL